MKELPRKLTYVSFGVVSAKISVAPLLKSGATELLYFAYDQGGAVIDDKIAVADVICSAGSAAGKYGAVNDINPDLHKLDAYLEANKVEKRRVWKKACAQTNITFLEHNVFGEYHVLLSRRVTNDNNYCSRLENAYSQTLYAAIAPSNDADSRFTYNVIRGVEIGEISVKELKAILESMRKDDLNKWKSAIGVKKLSVKTLFNDIKGK